MKKIFLSLSLFLMIYGVAFAQENKKDAAAMEVKPSKEKLLADDLLDTRTVAVKFVNALGLDEKQINRFIQLISLKKQKYSKTNNSIERKKELMSEFEKNAKLIVDERVLIQIKNNQEINDYLFAIKSEKGK